MGDIDVVMDPEQRQNYVLGLLAGMGFGSLDESVDSAYLNTSLHSHDENFNDTLRYFHKLFEVDILIKSGINPYDDESIPYPLSGPLCLDSETKDIIDSANIAYSRFYVWNNYFAAAEHNGRLAKAVEYAKMPVVITNNLFQFAETQPHCVIYLQYSDFEEQFLDFVPLFDMLMQYEPGLGFKGQTPVLLGFEKKGTDIVDLEEQVYREFPNLQYSLHDNTPILEVRDKTPGRFYKILNMQVLQNLAQGLGSPYILPAYGKTFICEERSPIHFMGP